MSRNSFCSTKAAPHAGGKLSAFDVGHSHIRGSKGSSPGRQDQLHTQKNSIQVGAQEAAEGGGSGDGAAGVEDSDAGDGDGNCDEEDESNNAEDTDATAPSDCTINADGHQTGPTIHKKASRAPTKLSVHNHQADPQHENSDDGVYEGLDLISDSEDDGSDMDSVEERAIIRSEEDDEPQPTDQYLAEGGRPTTETSSSDSSDDIWDGFDISQEHFGEPSDFFGELFSRTDTCNSPDGSDGDDFGGYPSEFAITTDDPSPSPKPTQRRVRFAEPPHSDIQGFNPNSDEDIFRNEVTGPTFSPGSGLDSNCHTDSEGSSGYETDGETTDEDEFPAFATARPQALMRRPSANGIKVSSSKTPAPAPKSNSQRWGPRMGTWCVDPTKHYAIVDASAKTLLIFPARRPAKHDRMYEYITRSASTTANNSPRQPFSQLAIAPNYCEIDHSDISSQGIVSPMFGPPNALDNVLSENNFLGTSPVYPDYASADAAFFADMGDDDDDDDYENGITMEDLINFDGGEDDSDVEMEDSRPSSSASDSNDLPAACHNTRSLLDHLDTQGVVTAFRQNQHMVEHDEQEILQPRSPLRKRKASPPLHAATRRRVMA